MSQQPKGPHGGARFHPPGRKYGRPPKVVKVKHLRSAIAEPESPEEIQAIEWWKGLSPKERLRAIVEAGNKVGKFDVMSETVLKYQY